MLRNAAHLWDEAADNGSVDEVAELVSEQSQSGQTVAAFCRERGLRDSQFYEWKKRVREAEAAKFVEVKLQEPRARAARGRT